MFFNRAALSTPAVLQGEPVEVLKRSPGLQVDGVAKGELTTGTLIILFTASLVVKPKFPLAGIILLAV